MDPRDLIRSFRSSYVNLYDLWTKIGRRPVGARLRRQADRLIDPAGLPPGLRSLLDEYREKHPGASITFYKFAHSVDGEPVDVIEDDAGLPDEDHLLTVSQTVTLLASDVVRVITDLYVARLGRMDETPVQLRKRDRNA